ncbi:hypothetical protein COK82_14975 [Bacillus thuringiensis]|nr:hypothetical protein COK82_14975 [Bacillus thuringiensis]
MVLFILLIIVGATCFC